MLVTLFCGHVHLFLNKKHTLKLSILFIWLICLLGARVSCIAADASSNTFAVASYDCRVFLYMWSSSSLGS